MESDVCKLCLKSKTDLMPVTKEISAEGSDDNCSYEQLISKLLDRNGTSRRLDIIERICMFCSFELTKIYELQQKWNGIQADYLDYLDKRFPAEEKIYYDAFEEIDESEQIPETEDQPLSLKSKELKLDSKLKTCPVCNKTFKASYKLKCHMRTHTKEKPFQCSQCPKSFGLAHTLRVHERIHSGLKPFKCDQCGESFAHNSGLSIHMRKHTGEKPYECDECHQKFATLSHYNYHVQTHTGIRKFKCANCTQSFVLKNDLKKHEKLHLGVKDFKCSICGLEMARKTHLIRHTKTHFKSAPHICKNCHEEFKDPDEYIKHLQHC